MKPPRYSSTSNLFAKRGDPWVSEREGIKDFNREPGTENPDYDFDHRFHYSRNARGKPKTVAPRAEAPSVVRRVERTEKDFARLAANVLLRMKDKPPVKVSEEKPQAFRLCPGCKEALCAARMRCAYPAGRKK